MCVWVYLCWLHFVRFWFYENMIFVRFCCFCCLLRGFWVASRRFFVYMNPVGVVFFCTGPCPFVLVFVVVAVVAGWLLSCVCKGENIISCLIYSYSTCGWVFMWVVCSRVCMSSGWLVLGITHIFSRVAKFIDILCVVYCVCGNVFANYAFIPLDGYIRLQLYGC